MKRTKEIEMPLLARKRVSYTVEHAKDKTPSRLQMRELVAKEAKTKPGLVSIRHIYEKYGQSKSKVIAHIYTDAKLKERLDPLKKKDAERLKKIAEEKQKAAEEAKKAAEAPKEEKAEEAKE